MERVIKIYLSSSAALEEDLKKVEAFISEFSKLLEEKHNVVLEILSNRSGEEYDCKISKSDLCVFLCTQDDNDPIGDELYYAYRQFGKEITKKSYVFTKKSTETSPIEYTLLETWLDINSFFFNVFNSIDVIKMRIIAAVKFGFLEKLDVQHEEEKVYVEGKEFLNADILPEVRNYKKFTDLKEKCLAEKSNEFCDQLKKLRCKIFALSMSIVKNHIQGRYSDSQKGAYTCVFEGDYESAMEYVDKKKLEDNYIYDIKHEPENKSELTKSYIYDTLAGVQIVAINHGSSFNEKIDAMIYLDKFVTGPIFARISDEERKNLRIFIENL